MTNRFYARAFRVQWSLFIVVLLAVFLCSPLWAQYSLPASSLNSGGDFVGAGTIYRIHTTLGQSGVIGFSEGANRIYALAWGFQAPPMGAVGVGPQIQAATISDVNNNGVIEPGDQLVLTMDRSVRVTTPVLQASHFFLPVAGDSLGRTNFAVRLNPHNGRQILLVLGSPTARLTTSGTFSMANRTSGSPSGIDLASSLPLGAIVGLDGIAAVDGGEVGVDDSGVDIELSMVGRRGNIGPRGGAVSVVPSPDAAYRQHIMGFPAGALSSTITIELRPPVTNLGVIGAVQVWSDSPAMIYGSAATVRLEYREGDVDWERGQIEWEMKVHQLVERPPGVFQYVVVPGQHIVLPSSMEGGIGKFSPGGGRVAVGVLSLNPSGSFGTPGIFAGLPIETVDERSVDIKPEGAGGIVRGQGVVIVMPGPRGAYTLHKIEIPNYVVTTAADPQRVTLRMRTATLAERWSATGGQSFPTQSGAVFAVTVVDAQSQPVEFTSPAHLSVQFKNRPDPAQTDVVRFDGRVGTAANMRLVRDGLAGETVNFEYVDAPTQIVNTTEGSVGVQNFIGLTGSDGMGVYGAVALELTTPAALWQLYR